MSAKSDKIIAHFTSDPALQAKIKKTLGQQKGNGSKAMVSAVVGIFDLEMDKHHALVGAILKGMAGHSAAAIAGYQIADPVKATAAAEKIAYHKHAVAVIQAS